MRKPQTPGYGQQMIGFVRSWGLSLLVLLMAISLLLWSTNLLRNPQVTPIRVVGVDGEMRYLDRDQLKETVYGAIDGSFFSVDLLKIRHQLELLPWVDSVTIRRVWPDRLQVRVKEQQPLAFWGEDAMLNLRGEIYRPRKLPDLPHLSHLAGMDEDSRQVAQGYQQMKSILLPIGLELKSARMDARRSWLLRTDKGVELGLGRREVFKRLRRFTDVYATLNQVDSKLLRVDLRYTNGFTALWESPREPRSDGVAQGEMGLTSRFAGI
jgi:cell division protein FtsQ